MLRASFRAGKGEYVNCAIALVRAAFDIGGRALMSEAKKTSVVPMAFFAPADQICLGQIH